MRLNLQHCLIYVVRWIFKFYAHVVKYAVHSSASCIYMISSFEIKTCAVMGFELKCCRDIIFFCEAKSLIHKALDGQTNKKAFKK